jgi:TonB family protein
MFEPKSLVSKAASRFLAPAYGKQQQQRRLMAAALTLLVFSLVFVLYHDRDFWFPDEQDTADEMLQPGPATASSSRPAVSVSLKEAARKKTSGGKGQLVASAQPVTSTPPIVATTTRTVLPPLEVEVVAGDAHQRLRPASNAVHLDLQPDSEDQPSGASQPRDDQQADNATLGNLDETAAHVTDKASERVEMSPDTSEMVSKSVKPGYPMLARQMKVQGSVILLAMIGRDGLIQDLRTLSGPPILSGAAREAVKQWHFKPHYEGSATVETVARITVNFTISTN